MLDSYHVRKAIDTVTPHSLISFWMHLRFRFTGHRIKRPRKRWRDRDRERDRDTDMEAHKERAEQLRREESHRRNTEQNANAGRAHQDSGSSTSVDQAAKVLIRETIVSGDGESGRPAGSGGAEDPGDVLAYSRSVNRIDSSLE